MAQWELLCSVVAVALHTFLFHLTARCTAPTFTLALVWPVTTCSRLLCYYRPGTSHTDSSVFTQFMNVRHPVRCQHGSETLKVVDMFLHQWHQDKFVFGYSMNPVMLLDILTDFTLLWATRGLPLETNTLTHQVIVQKNNYTFLDIHPLVNCGNVENLGKFGFLLETVGCFGLILADFLFSYNKIRILRLGLVRIADLWIFWLPCGARAPCAFGITLKNEPQHIVESVPCSSYLFKYLSFIKWGTSYVSCWKLSRVYYLRCSSDKRANLSKKIILEFKG